MPKTLRILFLYWYDIWGFELSLQLSHLGAMPPPPLLRLRTRLFICNLPPYLLLITHVSSRKTCVSIARPYAFWARTYSAMVACRLRRYGFIHWNFGLWYARYDELAMLISFWFPLYSAAAHDTQRFTIFKHFLQCRIASPKSVRYLKYSLIKRYREQLIRRRFRAFLSGALMGRGRA